MKNEKRNLENNHSTGHLNPDRSTDRTGHDELYEPRPDELLKKERLNLIREVQPFFFWVFYRTNAKYRKYKEDADRLYHDVKGYENGASANPMYLMKLEDITKGDDFVRMQIIRETEAQLSEINKAANKADGKERKELRRLYNESLQEVVELLDSVGK